MSTSIALDTLTKSFGGPRPAVDRVSLRVDAGELFFLLGPSGCGKTTLLRMIAGFIEPTAGSITFETPAGTRDVTNLPPNKRNAGMVFQSYALWPHMTVEANVAFGLNVRRTGAPEKKRRVAEALELVRMSEYAARKPNQLSGGQQQRVALARALVIRPDVLLLDEPLSNLDARLRIELRAEIRRICKEAGANGRAMTALYVTHDQKEALSMADRIAIMRDGRVVQTGAPRELYRSPSSSFVAEFLGETNFIPGVVKSVGEPTHITTDAGDLFARTSSSFLAGARVLCSIRPEALRVVSSGSGAINILKGVVSRTTYLGDAVQLDVHLVPPPGVGQGSVPAVKVLIMNPAGPGSSSGPVLLAADANDIVLLPAE